MTSRSVLIGGVEMAVRCLEALCAAGRPPGLAIGYSESLRSRSGYASLTEVCGRYGVPLIETDDVNAPDVSERIREARPDGLLVVAWSQLLRPEIIELATHGAVGLHPTALPLGRGRAPIPWTLIKGLTRSAVTLFKLTPTVDDGPILAQEPFDVSIHDDASTLYAKVSDLYVKILLANVDAVLSGTAVERPQVGKSSTWPRRQPEDGAIDWSRSAKELYDWVRGLTHPFPGAFATLPDGNRLTVWAADLVELGGRSIAPAGTVLGSMRRAGAPDGAIMVAAGADLIALRTVALAAGEMPGVALLDNAIVEVGDIFG